MTRKLWQRSTQKKHVNDRVPEKEVNRKKTGFTSSRLFIGAVFSVAVERQPQQHADYMCNGYHGQRRERNKLHQIKSDLFCQTNKNNNNKAK